MEKYLSENYKRPAPDTALLARITGGRIGQATAIDLSEYRRERREVLEMLELLAARNDRVRLVKAAEYYGKQEREEFEKRLGMIAFLLRDALLLASGRDHTAILNNDEHARLQRLAQNTGVRELIRWAEGFDELRNNLKVNINRQLATEALLLQLNESPRATGA
jgi:DNA polymerase III gamma/tau subunit